MFWYQPNGFHCFICGSCFQIWKFQMMLFFRSDPCLNFKFNKAVRFFVAKVESVDVFFNQTTKKTQPMHGTTPWKGAREKDSKSMQCLIEALTKPWAKVLDAYALTCEYISITIWLRPQFLGLSCHWKQEIDHSKPF